MKLVLENESDFNMKELELAKQICNCKEVEIAISTNSHPCYKVVNQQTKLINSGVFSENERQRPEPWIGPILDAPLLFISSNPSISDEPGEIREDFPTYEWTIDKSAEFFVNRFNPNVNPVHATFNHPLESNFLVKCRDGEYRSGMKNQKAPQATWNSIHMRAIELLGEEANPNLNYALTEIVHCKSKNAIGVKEAASFCMNQWLFPILESSKIKVAVLVGSHVAKLMKNYPLKTYENFGSSAGYNALSIKDRALRDIHILRVGDRNIVVIYNAHNGSSSIQKLPQVYGSKVIEWVSSILRDEIAPPDGVNALRDQLEELTK